MIQEKFPIHQTDIEDFSVVRCLHDASVIEHRFAGSVLSNQMEMHIVICAVQTGVNLRPNACLYAFLFLGRDQIPEPVVGELKKIIQVGAAGQRTIS